MKITNEEQIAEKLILGNVKKGEVFIFEANADMDKQPHLRCEKGWVALHTGSYFKDRDFAFITILCVRIVQAELTIS